MRRKLELTLGAALFLGGCFATDLDPTIEGAFACAEDTDCPAGQACDGSRCINPDSLPELMVLNPEPGQVFGFDSFNSMVSINVRGNLDLVEPSDEIIPGAGYVELIVDGAVTRITDGDLSAGIVTMVEVGRVAGGHRISAVAFRPDGERYANPEAVANTLFWLDDGRPHIAMTSPWPGTEFPLEATSTEMQIATLNFTLRAPEIDVMEGIGHAHFHYDDSFPMCAADTMGCDAGYIAVATPPPGPTSTMAGGEGLLPEEMTARTVALTAILRNDNHCPYFHPFVPLADDADPNDCPEPGDGGELVLDTIEISRVE